MDRVANRTRKIDPEAARRGDAQNHAEVNRAAVHFPKLMPAPGQVDPRIANGIKPLKGHYHQGWN